MATDSSIARRTNQVIERIEKRCALLSGGKTLKLPTRSRHGAAMLLLNQLSSLADFLDAIEAPESSPYTGMTNAELKALVAQREIPFKGKANNAALIAALEAADREAAEKATENAQSL